MPGRQEPKGGSRADEKLIRQELPIQYLTDRSACVAIAPVHLGILELPLWIRTDDSLVKGIVAKVRNAYNRDIAYHLRTLERTSVPATSLKGYERFGRDWSLGGITGIGEFLNLNWIDSDGSVHTIECLGTPAIMHNQYNSKGRFFTPEDAMGGGNFTEHFEREAIRPNVVYMSPAKLRKYGIETGDVRIDERSGIAEVVAHEFVSKYTDMAKALLLRAFAVTYLNKLLEHVEDDTISFRA